MNSSREDYLQAIYRLSMENGYTSNKAIADFLGVTKASVSEMIKKLNDSQMVTLDRSKISLTDKGKKQARKMLSKHRIWEYFLRNQLGMDFEEAHQQADLLEHVTSEKLKEALNKYLGYPMNSPRGKIIYDNVKETEGQ